MVDIKFSFRHEPSNTLTARHKPPIDGIEINVSDGENSTSYILTRSEAEELVDYINRRLKEPKMAIDKDPF